MCDGSGQLREPHHSDAAHRRSGPGRDRLRPGLRNDRHLHDQPRRHGVHRFDQTLTAHQLRYTYPALLKRAGSRVGHVGKWVFVDPPTDLFDYLRWFSGTGWFYENGDRSTRHLTGRLGDDVLEFLGQQSPEHPFCLAVAFKAPHVQDQWTDQFPFNRADKNLGHLYQDVTTPA